MIVQSIQVYLVTHRQSCISRLVEVQHIDLTCELLPGVFFNVDVFSVENLNSSIIQDTCKKTCIICLFKFVIIQFKTKQVIGKRLKGKISSRQHCKIVLCRRHEAHHRAKQLSDRSFFSILQQS